jgi:hypothetical protein
MLVKVSISTIRNGAFALCMTAGLGAETSELYASNATAGFADAGDGARNIIVLNQGYDSCRPELSRNNAFLKTQMVRLKELLKSKSGIKNSDVIHSCFGPSKEFELKYWLQDQTEEHRAPSIDAFLDVVKSRIASSSTRHVVVVGHSHGGWLAMKVVNSLDRRVTVDHLVTIDPISYEACQPSTLAGTMLGSLLGRNGSRGVCVGLSKDVLDMIADIRGKVSFWQQHYVTKTAYLHSEPIPEADENHWYDFPEHSSWNYEPHIVVRERSDLWEKVLRHWH